jgi:uncharacterized protein (DUF488 family)
LSPLSALAQKTARDFFTLLKGAGVRHLLDVRLNNNSQLAAFSKKNDLAFFCEEIVPCSYHHLTILAPTEELFTSYKKLKGDWTTFRQQYVGLLEERRVEKELDRSLFRDGCLLCSEHQPHACHRSLVAAHLQKHWGNMEVVHLL